MEQEIFNAAVKISNQQIRQQFIAESCGVDLVIRERVESLLVAHEDSIGLKAGAWFHEVYSENPGSGDAEWNPPDVDELNSLFEQITVESLIGRGGMGAVYRGRQDSLERSVAIKILPPEVASDPGFTERFRREAIAMGRLQHPNIVSIYDYGEVGGFYFLLMEYVHGTDVQELIRLGELDPNSSIQIMTQVCEALDHAHRVGYVHRDIKPANILVTDSGEVRVADFGLAKLTGFEHQARESAQLNLTREGTVVGTPNYLAPEHVTQGNSADPRNDIFSLGVMFYEMLTGDLPKGVFRPPSEQKAGDENLDKIVMRAMSADPEERYQEVSQIKNDISSLDSSAPRHTRRKKLILLSVCFIGALVGAVALSSRLFAPQPAGSADKSDVGFGSTPVWSGWSQDEPAPAISPFTPIEAEKHQKEWASHMRVPVRFVDSLGIAFRLIPPGEYLQGTDRKNLKILAKECEPLGDWYVENLQGESPQRRVVIARPFAMSETEITVGQYSAFIEDSEYSPEGRSLMEQLDSGERDNLPANQLSWNDAQAFCSWLSERESVLYQLPDEAKWEYACRSGNPGRYCFGDSIRELEEYAWFERARVEEVGLKKPNAFGLYDMHGNVYEWCHDGWQDYPSAPSLFVDPIENDGKERVIRGGYYGEVASMARSADRRPELASDKADGHVGFRVMRALD